MNHSREKAAALALRPSKRFNPRHRPMAIGPIAGTCLAHPSYNKTQPAIEAASIPLPTEA